MLTLVGEIHHHIDLYKSPATRDLLYRSGCRLRFDLYKTQRAVSEGFVHDEFARRRGKLSLSSETTDPGSYCAIAVDIP